MTTHIRIPAVTPSVQTMADGTGKIFEFPFPIFTAADLEVFVGDVPVADGFAVRGSGSSEGGAVVFVTAPASGLRVTLRRRQDYARTDDFLDERAPTPHELNDAVDQNVAALQELADESARAVKRSATADLSRAVDLTLPEPEAGKVLGWNGSANALVNLTQVDVSDMLRKSQNLADLPDKAQARINLGLGSAATHAEADFATAAQGAKADSALQPGDIGTSVQAQDVALDWLAANISDAGKALLDDADAADQRVTLGLGTAATKDVGTAAGQVVMLDASAKLPAVDGSQLSNLPLLPFAALGGFKALKVAATSDTQVDITVDAIALDNGSGGGMIANGINLTLSTTCTGENGLDLGSITASTWYSVWVISDGSNVAGLLSTSATAPTLPGAYTFKARIAWVRINASGTLVRTLQYGRDAQYVLSGSPNSQRPLTMALGAATYPTAISVQPFVPPTASVIKGLVRNGYAGYASVTPNSSWQDQSFIWNNSGSTSVDNGVYFEIVIEGSSIYFSGTSGTGNNAIDVVGWKDNL